MTEIKQHLHADVRNPWPPWKERRYIGMQTHVF